MTLAGRRGGGIRRVSSERARSQCRLRVVLGYGQWWPVLPARSATPPSHWVTTGSATRLAVSATPPSPWVTTPRRFSGGFFSTAVASGQEQPRDRPSALASATAVDHRVTTTDNTYVGRQRRLAWFNRAINIGGDNSALAISGSTPKVDLEQPEHRHRRQHGDQHRQGQLRGVGTVARVSPAASPTASTTSATATSASLLACCRT